MIHHRWETFFIAALTGVSARTDLGRGDAAHIACAIADEACEAHDDKHKLDELNKAHWVHLGLNRGVYIDDPDDRESYLLNEIARLTGKLDV